MSVIVPWPAGRECNDLVTTIMLRGAAGKSASPRGKLLYQVGCNFEGVVVSEPRRCFATALSHLRSLETCQRLHKMSATPPARFQPVANFESLHPRRVVRLVPGQWKNQLRRARRECLGRRADPAVVHHRGTTWKQL